MYKKRILTLGIMIFAFISVIGVGFSSWYFSNQKRQDANSNVLVTHANTFGEFEARATEAYVLQLDQPTRDNSGTITASNIGLFSVGTPNTAVSELSATWKVSLEEYNDTVTGSTSNIEYSVIVYLKKTTLDQYVTIDGATSITAEDIADHAHATDYNAYKITLTGSETSVDATGAYITKPTGNTGDVSVALKLKLASLFQWKNGADGKDKAPKDFSEYQAMVQGLQCEDSTTVTSGKEYKTAGKDIIFEFVVSNPNA